MKLAPWLFSVGLLLALTRGAFAQSLDITLTYGQLPIRVYPGKVRYELVNPYWLPADTLRGSVLLQGRYSTPHYSFSLGISDGGEFGITMNLYEGSFRRIVKHPGDIRGGGVGVYGGFRFTRGKFEITPRYTIGFQLSTLTLGQISTVGDTLLVGDSLLVKGPYAMSVSRPSFSNRFSVAVAYPVLPQILLFCRAEYALTTGAGHFAFTDLGTPDGSGSGSGSLRLDSSYAAAWAGETLLSRKNVRKLLFSSSGFGWEAGICFRIQ